MAEFLNAMINKDRVSAIFIQCLSGKEEKNNPDQITVEATNLQRNGFVSIHFNPECLKDYKDEISDILNNLPSNFIEGYGTIEQAYFDKEGNKWTNLFDDAQVLLLLGVAIKKIERYQEDGELRFFTKRKERKK